MEVVPVVTSDGRTLFEVRFNGSAITGCFHDTDCPAPGQICAVNETWASLPSMCTCDAIVGKLGYNCDEPGPLFIFMVATSVFALLVTLVSLFASAASMGVMLAKKSERRLSNMMISLIVSLLTSAVYSVALMTTLASFISLGVDLLPGKDYRYPSRITKVRQLFDVYGSLIALMFALATVDMFFLSGVWTGLAVSFKKLSLSKGKWVQAFCIFYFIFAIAVLVPTMLVRSLWTVNAAIMFIVSIILCISFLFTGYKVREMTIAVSSNAQQNSGSSENRVTFLLTRMYYAAFTLSLLNLGAIVSLALYGLGVPRRPSYIPPMMSQSPREVATRIAIVIYALAVAVVIRYLCLVVLGKKPTESSAPNGSKSLPVPNTQQLLSTSSKFDPTVRTSVKLETGNDSQSPQSPGMRAMKVAPYEGVSE